jgi:hypothetical protein
MDMKLASKMEKNLKLLKENLFRKNNRGLSGVITAVLMIALVMVIVVIVWVVVRNIVQGQIGSVESCFEVYDKVTINNLYTCYNSTSNHFQFSIKVEDIELDKIIISVSSEGSTKSYLNKRRPRYRINIIPFWRRSQTSWKKFWFNIYN